MRLRSTSLPRRWQFDPSGRNEYRHWRTKEPSPAFRPTVFGLASYSARQLGQSDFARKPMTCSQHWRPWAPTALSPPMGNTPPSMAPGIMLVRLSRPHRSHLRRQSGNATTQSKTISSTMKAGLTRWARYANGGRNTINNLSASTRRPRADTCRLASADGTAAGVAPVHDSSTRQGVTGETMAWFMVFPLLVRSNKAKHA